MDKEREKMGGINISNYPQLKNDYGSFPSITKDLTTVPKDAVNVDSFVSVQSTYTSSELGEAARAYLEGDRATQTSPMDDCIDQFFDGTMSGTELQAEYEKLLKKELFGSMENPTGPLSASQKEIAANFYDAFREKNLSAAVQRNNTEGEQYITGEMNVQRNWSYYNSDYYYASEAAISAITEGAQNVSQEYVSSFEVPDYMAQGRTNLYNFNTALSGDPFVVSDYHYIIDPDVAPSENFKWFYEKGGDAYSTTIRFDSFTVEDAGGNKIVTDYTTDVFDSKDPRKAQTWVSYTDENGVEHRLSTDIVFNNSKEDLRNVADLLFFPDKDTDKASLLNQFLSNLQLYPKRYFDRFPMVSRSMDFMV